MAPIVTNFATRERYVTDHMESYYKARVEGRVGLIIIKAARFDALTEKLAHSQLTTDDSNCVSGLRELARVIHGHGAKTATQTHHAYRNITSAVTRHQLIGASRITFPGDELVGMHIGFETPGEITIIEIEKQGKRRQKWTLS